MVIVILLKEIKYFFRKRNLIALKAEVGMSCRKFKRINLAVLGNNFIKEVRANYQVYSLSS
jgi:hypothetical protein